MVVFDDDLAATHFLNLARDEMDQAGTNVPLLVSSGRLLERSADGVVGEIFGMTAEGLVKSSTSLAAAPMDREPGPRSEGGQATRR